MRWAFLGPGQGQDFLPTNFSEFKRLYSGNTGNLVYYFATKCAINFQGGSFGLGAAPEILNKRGSGLVFSMANQLGSHTDLSKRGLKLNNLNVPLVGLGLGAQTKYITDDISYIPKGTIDYLKEFVSKSLTDSPNITVRGDYTYSIMEKLGLSEKIISIGCQTNFINSNKNLGREIAHRIKDKDLKKITVAAGSPYNKNLMKLETSLLSHALNSKGDYVIQHPESLIKLVANFSEDEFQEAWNKVYPIYGKYGFTENEFIEAIHNNFKLYSDVPQWMRSHRQSDIVIGTRIHGVQSALQSGIPAVCLYIDTRTKELCEKMKIPHASALEYEKGILYKNIIKILNDWDYEEYDKNRLLLAKDFKVFLENNSITISDTLSKLST